MQEIDVHTLKAWQDEGKDFQLIDVREPSEYEMANLGGALMPLGEILEHSAQISKDKPVVVHCRSGKRSEMAIRQLETKEGFTNLYNLTGGIMAYGREIDPSKMVP
jgi:rhodanese-related sulfurtransferase